MTTSGDIDVRAQHSTGSVSALANGIVGKGAVDVGYNRADATMVSNVSAYVDQGTMTSTGGSVTIAANEGMAGDGTGPAATSRASQGFYSGGDNLASSAHTTHEATVRAFIGNPDPNGPAIASTAQVIADRDLSVTAGSWTTTAPEALTGPNASFVANSEAEATATVTKQTLVYVSGDGAGKGARATAGGTLTLAATSDETLSPLAEGFDGEGVSATGSATTTANLSRVTNITVSEGAVLTAESSMALAALSTTRSSGSLTDNQGNGAYSSSFHAGQGDSASGTAKPMSVFNIGQNGGDGATSIDINGALTAPTVTLDAHTAYDITVNSFAWVTSASLGANVQAFGTVNTQDDVRIVFGEAGSVTATDSVSLDAGYAPGSVVRVITKLHYSEDLEPVVGCKTESTTNLNGLIGIQDNDFSTGVTAPHITSSLDTNPGADVHWLFTVTDHNHDATFGTHDLNTNGDNRYPQ